MRRDFTANSPILTIDQELFDNTMSIGIEAVLNQLPQFVPAREGRSVTARSRP